MGKLLPQFKKSIIDDIISSITSNTAAYYAFAANPAPYPGNTVPAVTLDDYTSSFTSEWQMIFGKKISNTDILPMINNIGWANGAFYTRYDNTKDISSSSYYVVVPPSLSGGTYNIFKCIDNANNSASTVFPNQLQPKTFSTSDGYKWRYITTISSGDYTRLATSAYIPVYPNNSIVTGANSYNGVDVVNIVNGGTNYSTWSNGIVQFANTTVIQISNTASSTSDIYTKSGIYLYNNTSPTAQIKTITKYVSNLSGNWVYLDTAANTQNITVGSTQYYISPRVVFQTDSNTCPSAYSIVNPQGNSISSIVIIDPGYGISWANVSIQSNTAYGSGANVYAIVPPAGGHGFNPANELITQGMGISFFFSNTENNTIPNVVTYNKIGLIKNPYTINTTSGNKTTTPYTSNTFISLVEVSVSPPTIFTVGDTVTGLTTNAVGTVAFSNSSVLYLTGDKYFANSVIQQETIISSNGSQSAVITINTRGNIYTKDLTPLYIQNIDNVNRLSGRTETFKLIIQI